MLRFISFNFEVDARPNQFTAELLVVHLTALVLHKRVVLITHFITQVEVLQLILLQIQFVFKILFVLLFYERLDRCFGLLTLHQFHKSVNVEVEPFVSLLQAGQPREHPFG